jgi:hypothetical protein
MASCTYFQRPRKGEGEALVEGLGTIPKAVSSMCDDMTRMNPCCSPQDVKML